VLKRWILLGCLLWACQAAKADVLIVADEFPAMQVLAAKLQADQGVASQLVAQTNMPASLSAFEAVIVYIHLGLLESAEAAFIAYTQQGGKLIVLHHSISSGKRRNRDWFPFLGVSLPEGEVDRGGYKWTEGVTLELVKLAPDHFITTNRVHYPARISWRGGEAKAAERLLPGFVLPHSEVYLNHVLAGPRTLLLGLRYTDAASGKTYEQTHAGWVKRSAKGWIVYLMAGHSTLDFQDPTYSRLVLNAVAWNAPH
jgi:hypothetical protein